MKSITFISPDGSYTQYEYDSPYADKNDVAVRTYDGKGVYADGFITEKQALSQIKKLTKAWKKSLFRI